MAALALCCLILDQGVKALVRHAMAPGQSIALWSGVFHITRVQNTGVAFSLFNDHPGLLLFLTSLLFTGFLVFSLRQSVYSRLELVGFALVLGGAAGNIVDRAFFGRVTDFLDFLLIHYPVFNLADSFICVGVSLLVWHGLRTGS